MSNRVHNTSFDPSHQGEACSVFAELAQWLECDAAEVSLEASLAEHLARCVFCQRRLSESAAAEPWWEAAAEYLAEPEPEETLTGLAIPGIATSAACDSDSVPAASAFAEQLPEGLLQPPSHPELLGRLGRYEIERLIGQGGMGLVFRAFDPQLHRVVAVKLLAPQLAASATARQRFAREARAVAALAHPHLVAIHDVVADGPLPYLVMTYIDGVSLEELVRRRGPLPIDQVIQLARQLSAALATAHDAGLIHRDIKPGNILCEADGQRAVLTDFGLVRTLDDATLTHSGILAGTPHYMAPEQARGNTVGPQSDLWGVGAVLYFSLAGRPPFEAEHPMAVLHQVCSTRPDSIKRLRPDVPAALAAIVQRLLEKNPADRYRDCAALKDDLDRLMRGGSSRWRMSRSSRSRRRLRLAAAVSVAAGVLAISLTLFYRPRAEPRVEPIAADVAADTDLVNLQQADARWRWQLNELYAQTDLTGASAALLAVQPAPLASTAASELLTQMQQLEAATSTSQAVSEFAPRSSFAADMQVTLDLLDKQTPSAPFASP